MSQDITIRNNVPSPTDDKRVCSECGQNKPVDDFSLKRGKHSGDRKTYCVQCETKIRAAKKVGLTVAEMESMLRRPCSLCGHESHAIDVDHVTKEPVGVLCKKCDAAVKHALTIKNGEYFLHAHNYLTAREKFPFLLKQQLEYQQPEPSMPLLDYIERE